CTEAIRRLVLSAHNAEFGRNHKAPEALLTAGSILRTLQVQWPPHETETVVEDEKGNKVDPPGEKLKSLDDQVSDLFDEAQVVGNEQRLNVAALGKAVKARRYSKTRCGAVALRQVTRKIPAGRTHRFTIHFSAEKPATIAVLSNAPVRFEVTAP